MKGRRLVAPPLPSPAKAMPVAPATDAWALRKQRWIRRSKFVIVWRIVIVR